MPELPEIESLAFTLKPLIQGRQIKKVRIRRHFLRKKLPARLARGVDGFYIHSLARRGKYLLIYLSKTMKMPPQQIIIAHLGMSGRLIFDKPRARQKHDHVVFVFDEGEMVFNDTRRFGFLDLIFSCDCDDYPAFKRLGFEPLSDWPLDLWVALLKNRRLSLKAALLNQEIVAGIGNIYACESLHHAKLSPWRACGELSIKEYQRLRASVITQLKRAVLAGGATFRDYLDGSGKKGKYQFHIYQRAGTACLCGGVIHQKRQNGRSTFYCPLCQK